MMTELKKSGIPAAAQSAIEVLYEDEIIGNKSGKTQIHGILKF